MPSNVFIHFIRRLYCVFVLNRPANTEGNPDRLLLVYDTISNSATFDFLHCLYYADWRRRQVGKTYLDVLIVSRSQQFLLEESYVAAVGEDSSYWRIANVLYPLCNLFSSLGRVYIVEQEEALEIVKRYQSVHPEEYNLSNFKTADVRLDLPGVDFYPALKIADTAQKIVEAIFHKKMIGELSRSLCELMITFQPVIQTLSHGWTLHER